MTTAGWVSSPLEADAMASWAVLNTSTQFSGNLFLRLLGV
jgi:hypothetical protein